MTMRHFFDRFIVAPRVCNFTSKISNLTRNFFESPHLNFFLRKSGRVVLADGYKNSTRIRPTITKRLRQRRVQHINHKSLQSIPIRVNPCCNSPPKKSALIHITLSQSVLQLPSPTNNKKPKTH